MKKKIKIGVPQMLLVFCNFLQFSAIIEKTDTESDLRNSKNYISNAPTRQQLELETYIIIDNRICFTRKSGDDIHKINTHLGETNIFLVSLRI